MSRFDEITKMLQTASTFYTIGYTNPAYTILFHLATGLIDYVDPTGGGDGQKRLLFETSKSSFAVTPEQAIFGRPSDVPECTLTISLLGAANYLVKHKIVLRIRPSSVGNPEIWVVEHGPTSSEVDLSSQKSIERFYERASYALAYSVITKVLSPNK